jgi:NADPH:quinone reductase-like Zn-dependent oxidoreductase
VLGTSGLNPGDIKKRADAFGLGMAYPRVIPHSDGAGVIDAVGACRRQKRAAPAAPAAPRAGSRK